MTYLLIAFVLAIILSPLMWFRQSPRQKLITEMRKQATAKGIRVKLSKPADAREGEGRLEFVTYTLPWLPDSSASMESRMEKWLLVKGARRGYPSNWKDWKWLGREGNAALMTPIGYLLDKLPENVSALEACSEGVRIYWQERAQLHDVQVIFVHLERLRETIRQ